MENFAVNLKFNLQFDLQRFADVCKIGNTNYESITAAITAASSGDTITMLADVTGLSSAININKEITLDLNGKTISGSINSKGIFNIVSGGNLTVTDSSSGGTIENTDQLGYAIDNRGKVDISGGTFIGDSAVIRNSEGGKVTISGGNFTGNTVAIENRDESTVEISGGTFTSEYTAIDNGKYGTIEISGGTFSGFQYAIDNSGTVDISGGTFTGEIENFEEGTITISGGTFNKNVASVSGVTIATGYAVANNGDGTYTVSEVTDITKTETIDGVTVTLTFDSSSNNLKNAEGTGVTYDSENNQFTCHNHRQN